MRSLIGWDDPQQAELISLYLNVDDDEAVVTTDDEALLAAAGDGSDWDVVLVPTDVPDADTAFARFERLRAALPQQPIVGACRSGNVFHVARFLSHGLRSYVPRDLEGDFVFLLSTTLRSIVEADRAERERIAAERMREEIESVRRFQDSVIPHELANPPGYVVDGRYEPSRIEVRGSETVVLAGGDYYDVLQLDSRTWVLMVGDAAGHGMRACMSIMAMYTLVHVLDQRVLRKPGRFLEEVNRKFCAHAVTSRNASLVTFFFGVLRVDRHELSWSSAAHPAPVLHEFDRALVAPIAEPSASGPPLGFDEHVRYPTVVTKLPPHSRLLVYTDGLTEAHPHGHPDRQFGLGGIRRSLISGEALDNSAALDRLFASSLAFTDGAGRHDDSSALLVGRP